LARLRKVQQSALATQPGSGTSRTAGLWNPAPPFLRSVGGQPSPRATVRGTEGQGARPTMWSSVLRQAPRWGWWQVLPWWSGRLDEVSGVSPVTGLGPTSKQAQRQTYSPCPRKLRSLGSGGTGSKGGWTGGVVAPRSLGQGARTSSCPLGRGQLEPATGGPGGASEGRQWPHSQKLD
jgi:hypothetical protein